MLYIADIAAFEYSPAFRRLISDEQRLRALLAGSCYFDATWDEWERGRQFIASAINQDGALLDIGCGNGFLLRCLQEWTPYVLEPYGIDIDQARLHQARQLFPQQRDQFAICDAARFARRDLNPVSTMDGFPTHFELIFWNVWDNMRHDDPTFSELLDGMLNRLKLGGRLILGFYDASKSRNLARIEELAALGYHITDSAAAHSSEEVIVWLDHSDEAPATMQHDGTG